MASKLEKTETKVHNETLALNLSGLKWNLIIYGIAISFLTFGLRRMFLNIFMIHSASKVLKTFLNKIVSTKCAFVYFYSHNPT